MSYAPTVKDRQASSSNTSNNKAPSYNNNNSNQLASKSRSSINNNYYYSQWQPPDTSQHYQTPISSIQDISRSIQPVALTKKNNNNLLFQPKLRISQPNDAYEQEADRVAEKVMAMSSMLPFSYSAVPPTGGDARSKAKGREIGLKKCTACQIKDQQQQQQENIEIEISRKPSHASNLEASDQVSNEIINSVLSSSSGSPLDVSTKEFMESRFGYDFTKVRIHTDAVAAESANSVNALAYTVGNDIVFANERYRPNTFEGRNLLAHELTHIIQQASELSLEKLWRTPNDSTEQWRLNELKNLEREEGTIDLTLFPFFEGMPSEIVTLVNIAQGRVKKGSMSLPIERFDDILPSLEWLIEKLRSGQEFGYGLQNQLHHFIRELHIMGHGGKEWFQFGGYAYKTEDLYGYESGLFSTFLAPGGTIYMEGCNVAAGDAGIRYLSEIGRIFFGNDGWGFIRGNTCEITSIVGLELQECKPLTLMWPADFP